MLQDDDYRQLYQRYGSVDRVVPYKYQPLGDDERASSYQSFLKGQREPKKDVNMNLNTKDIEGASPKKIAMPKGKKRTDFFKENPEATTKNVVFGVLNKFEWYLLERKHLNHHFEQFNLLPESL